MQSSMDSTMPSVEHSTLDEARDLRADVAYEYLRRYVERTGGGLHGYEVNGRHQFLVFGRDALLVAGHGGETPREAVVATYRKLREVDDRDPRPHVAYDPAYGASEMVVVARP
jgi:hypothetical protein